MEWEKIWAKWESSLTAVWLKQILGLGLAHKHCKMATLAMPDPVASSNPTNKPTEMVTASTAHQTDPSSSPTLLPIKCSTSSSAKPLLANVAGAVCHITPIPVPPTSSPSKTLPPHAISFISTFCIISIIINASFISCPIPCHGWGTADSYVIILAGEGHAREF